MLDNTYLTASIFQPALMHPGCAFTQIEQAVPDDILKHLSFGFQFIKKPPRLPWSYILPKHNKAWKAGRPIVGFSAHPAKKFLAVLARVLDGLVRQVCPHTGTYNEALDLWQIYVVWALTTLFYEALLDGSRLLFKGSPIPLN